MDRIYTGQAEIWRTVYELIEQMKSKPYDDAAEHLKQLKALANYQGESAAFNHKLTELREKYPRRFGLLRRLDEV